ncbi:hypothetical protein HELRODRAFT_97598 [Helobdella robusta]|uniref:Mediator of RNA polymerase II transcription subunit 17 n=1 Tax=Helobdella robusta TaxID=6412 RepID=T1G9H9_HELRO|nr:hypothetical protein HELRODRAFT_97598 [Helobdella robusta]ESO09492.1 hypothetical protein HELRODRAFT_97598 [Helobdella robusta]
MTASVDVSVEVLQECMIQEVTLDGQEIYVLPLTMSENLTKMAHKIDFSKDEFDGKSKQLSEAVDEEEEDEEENENERQYPKQTLVQPSLWPWDSVRNKLRSALTELTALQDILTISRDRRYMTLDYVQHDAGEAKSAFLLVARKRAIASSAGFMNTGMERMKKNLEQIMKNKNHDFHYELLKLRKIWRLKKVGGSILGDLSYKSAGSHFWVSGTFEVVKTDSEAADNEPGTSLQHQQQQPMHPIHSPLSNLSNLNVIIPDELSGNAYIRIIIKRVNEKDCSISTFFSQNFLSSSSSSSSTSSEQLSWSKRLELAQNVLFCKELFAQLYQEAMKHQSRIPNMACGNHIVCHLFPDVKLFISLCHTTEQNKSNNGNKPALALSKQHNSVLEHSVYQLLREIHYNNTNFPPPRPVTMPLGFIKKRHHLGPAGSTKSQISDFNLGLPRNIILWPFVSQAKHYFNRQRVINMIDEIVIEVHEPQIIVHTSYLNSATSTGLRLTMAFSGFEHNKTCIMLYIYETKLEVACKDGSFQTLDVDFKQLRRFIMEQVTEHHLLMVSVLAKAFDWKILSMNKNCFPPKDYIVSRDCGYYDDETVKMHHDEELTGDINPSMGMLIISPKQNRMLSIHCFRNNTQIVKVCRKPGVQQASGASVEAVENEVMQGCEDLPPKWQETVDCFEFVYMEYLPGKNFAQKLEVLMAALVPDLTA